MSLLSGTARAVLLLGMLTVVAPTASGAEPAFAASKGLQPNLTGQLAQALRYRPDGDDFVIKNGGEFFNRSLYGGHTAFRIDGGDKPEFLLYLPGRGGNLRLAIKTAAGVRWLHEAANIVTRYRPGELRYEIRDPMLGPKGVLNLEALAYANTEGLILRARARKLASDAELVWAYGGVTGVRGKRDGDIGTEAVPISQYFQLQPAFADGNRISLDEQGFTLTSKRATIAGVVPTGASQHLADAAWWNDLPALLSAEPMSANIPLVVGRARLQAGHPLLLSLQRTDQAAPAELATYAEAGAPKQTAPAAHAAVERLGRAGLASAFLATQRHFASLRRQVIIDTPDPYLNAAAGALNVVADALWDDKDQAIMHGAIAWRTKLLGWRGPYALDALGWHERARSNFGTWTVKQDTSAIPAVLPPPDAASHLARSEAALHSNGDLSRSHYDMNMVFFDALFRHLLWTGDLDYARQVWPAIERHLAWEQRLFRREYGPDKLPLYEGYAAIWASDDLYYGGGGATHASAYNVYAHRSAARLARLIGKDGDAYAREAELIAKAMRKYLWMPERGAFGEYRGLLGLQRLHPSYGLWSFYHAIDSEVPTAQEASLMAADLRRHLKPIPVSGPGVPADAAYAMLPSTDWMPYSWSINNVVMGENLHTALALWKAGKAADAWLLTRSSLLASMYMGISPGNVGSMNYLDVYRRESQRDFADGTGVMARTLIEGLFGLQPDALARTLTVRPGFPAAWKHASIRHPGVGLAFKRHGKTERWTVTQADARFDKLILRVPAGYDGVAKVALNGRPARWRPDPDSTGQAALLVEVPMGKQVQVDISWRGRATAIAPAAPAQAIAPVVQQPDWQLPRSGKFSSVDLAPWFNDKVSTIFKPGKYLAPRSPHVSLSLPSQGIGAWAGHVNDMATIDDSGLRQVSATSGGSLAMPNGVRFATPGSPDANNIIFTSRWNNYPAEVRLPLCGKASTAWLLMAGSTNHMQSRIDNGEVIVGYTDGSTARLALVNPDNWWPIEEDYFIDDYQFRRPGPVPARIDLKTGQVRLRVVDPGKRIDGGAATALQLVLDPDKNLRDLTLRTLSNDVVVGLMSLTLERNADAAPDTPCP